MMDSSVCQTAIDAAQSKLSAAQHYNVDYGMPRSEPCRQQTPLLNWGYATRMQSMWTRLHSSLAQLATKGQQSIQIVVLGPGLDQTGFRLVSAFPETITLLLEVDLAPICALKRDELLKTNRDDALTLNETDGGLSNASCKEGTIVLKGSYHHTAYSLVALDLNSDEKAMRAVFDSHLLDDDTPVLVVSELVVSYLTPASSDAVLTYFGQRPNCSILMYEALGADATVDADGVPTVADSYRGFYHDQFKSKLQSGKSGLADSLFYPLGTSLSGVEKRLCKAGFLKNSTRVSHPEIQSPCTQLFDEHAAMSLHLQTYVLAASSTASTGDRWFRQALQGDTVVVLPGEAYRLVPVLPEDAACLREAFAATYMDQASSSIQKMVQSVMRTDFASDDIGGHYRSMGGNFWVCCCSSDVENADESSTVVVGGLGLRRRSLAEVLSTPSISSSIPCYEVQRIFVQDGHRGVGIAKRLLELAEQTVRNSGYHRCNMLATTLTILETANKFYVAQGFREINRRKQGDLSYVTYLKETSNNI